MATADHNLINRVSVAATRGAELAAAIPVLAQLRMTVFRAFPYLYDGDLEAEEEYLHSYTASPDSVIVLARDGDEVIGAATALPLQHEPDFLVQPFEQHGIDPTEVFYFGESVLLPRYRGRGIGVRFFVEREAHARSFGERFRLASFCAVQRDAGHPRRPADYQALDEFWLHRGYTRQPQLRTNFPWREVDGDAEIDHTMVYWTKPLGAP